MGIGSLAPCSVSGSRPPSAASITRAPIRSSGSSTRRIGRLLKEASPMKVAVTALPATAPIARRTPVPELPKSSGPAGWAKPPTPTPWMRHTPSPVRSSRAPSARMASAVCSTSSPSKRPATVLSPTVSAPRIRARCEIDLSPGTRVRPCKGPPRRAVSGVKLAGFTGAILNKLGRPSRRPRGASSRRSGRSRAACAIDRCAATSQVKHDLPTILRNLTVAKTELGTKRICPETGRKFYDLGKTPVISPYTGKVVPIVVPAPSRSRPEPAAPAPVARPAPVPEPEVVVPETPDAEFVSLEDAEAEQQGQKAAAEGAAAAAEGEEVEIDESLDDAAFIEEEEEGDPDVTDIIGETIDRKSTRLNSSHLGISYAA